MLFRMPIEFRINEKDEDLEVYNFKSMDMDFEVNANANMRGYIMDIDFEVITTLIDIVKSLVQNVRFAVTINGVDYSDYFCNQMSIAHEIDRISSFDFLLAGEEVNPRNDTNLLINNEVIITAYINGQAYQLFKGLIADLHTEGKTMITSIKGLDYGKKLRKNIEVSAYDIYVAMGYVSQTPYYYQPNTEDYNNNLPTWPREKVIAYVASLADITNVEIPRMPGITRKVSFDYQEAINIISKLAETELYHIRFNENAIMVLERLIPKIDEDLYLYADWYYTASEYRVLNYDKNADDVANDVIVIGRRYASTRKHYETEEDIVFNINKTFADDEKVEDWEEENGNWEIYIIAAGGGRTYRSIIIGIKTKKIAFDIYNCYANATGGIIYKNSNILGNQKACINVHQYRDNGVFLGGTINIVIQGNAVNMTSETVYNNKSIRIIDENSQLKYGEQKEKYNKPLAENEYQCSMIAKEKIKLSHCSSIGEIDIEVNLNPLMIVGQTISLQNALLDIDERYFVNDIKHQARNDRNGKLDVKTIVHCKGVAAGMSYTEAKVED